VTKLWMNDDKLVIDGTGKIVLCGDCPCTGTASMVDCAECISGEAPWQVSVEIPSLGDTVNCSDCADFGGTYVISGVSNCEWQGTFANPTSCPAPTGDDEIIVYFNLLQSGFDLIVGVVLTYKNGTLICRWYRTFVSTASIDCDFDDLHVYPFDALYCDNSGTTGTASGSMDAIVNAV